MASTGVNVLRWSALGAGVVYGIYHQQSIRTREKQEASHAEYRRKEDLILKAKAEWAKKHPPKQEQKSGGAVADYSDPNFDLEKLLNTMK